MLENFNVGRFGLAFMLGFTGISALQAEEVNTELKWNGDLRYRHEYVDQNGVNATTKKDYHQQRIRARLGVKAAVNDNTEMEFRLATGTGRVSTNQTLGTGSSAFSNYAFNLDRAAFQWKGIDSFVVSGGRVGNPYYRAGESDLVWDGDVNFDGVALNYQTEWDSWTPFANVAGFWVDKTTTVNTRDVILGSAQLGFRHTLSEESNWSFGVAYYSFSHLRNHQVIGTATAPAGNKSTTVGTTSRYVSNFNLVNPGIEFKTKLLDYAMTFMVDYVTNQSPDSENDGYLVGVKVGESKAVGDWTLAYDYRDLEQEAVVAAFTEGDSFGGGTNGKGHRMTGTYQIAKNFSSSLTGYMGKAQATTTQGKARRNKIQADVVFKF